MKYKVTSQFIPHKAYLDQGVYAGYKIIKIIEADSPSLAEHAFRLKNNKPKYWNIGGNEIGENRVRVEEIKNENR